MLGNLFLVIAISYALSTMLFLGGATALSGKRVGGQCYLKAADFVAVSPLVYWYSYVHGALFVISMIGLIIIAVGLPLLRRRWMN